jgi:hypothetical protein
MRNVVGLLMVLVCLFVFSNTSVAQDCKNGKCPSAIQPGSKFLPKSPYYIAPESGGCKDGKCPSVKSSGGVVIPQGGVVIVPSGGFLVPKSDCPNGKCDNCPCPSGSCEKGSCVGSSYSAKSQTVTTITVSKGGPLRNLLGGRRNR